MEYSVYETWDITSKEVIAEKIVTFLPKDQNKPKT